MAVYGLKEFRRLEQDALEVPQLLLDSSLPDWLARSLANDAYTFSTCTWLTRDGRFATNAQGQLVTQTGDAVLDASGSPISLSLSGGPASIAADGRPAVVVWMRPPPVRPVIGCCDL